MENQAPKKKVMKRSEWWMLIICILILGYIILDKNGVHVVERTETVKMTNNPRQQRSGEPKIYRDEELEKRVDDVLNDMAREFSGEDQRKARIKEKDLRKKGLNKEEAAYYTKVKERNQLSDKIQTAKEWYNVLRASQETYDRVRSIFDTADGDLDREIDKQELNSILQNSTLSNQVFKNIQDNFKIPETQSKAFAREGKNSLSDWADFVETNKN